jgi:hypothetical protein
MVILGLEAGASRRGGDTQATQSDAKASRVALQRCLRFRKHRAHVRVANIDIRQISTTRTLYRAKTVSRKSPDISSKQFVGQVIKVLLFTKLTNPNTTSV